MSQQNLHPQPPAPPRSLAAQLANILSSDRTHEPLSRRRSCPGGVGVGSFGTLYTSALHLIFILNLKETKCKITRPRVVKSQPHFHFKEHILPLVAAASAPRRTEAVDDHGRLRFSTAENREPWGPPPPLSKTAGGHRPVGRFSQKEKAACSGLHIGGGGAEIRTFLGRRASIRL